MTKLLITICVSLITQTLYSQQMRFRDTGIEIGIFKTGTLNAITDVPGVKVGHYTKVVGEKIRTGVTAIIPHDDNIFQNKIPAAIYIANGFGKLAGYSQVKELGNLETPIILTNTLNVSTGIDALLNHTLQNEENEDVRSVNAVVGETNDGRLNDIRGRHLQVSDFKKALDSASYDNTEEGAIGAGTGTVCFGYKGGIGTSSRVLPNDLGAYTVGVLVQTNFGGILEIAGVPIGKELNNYPFFDAIQKDADGSCMIVVLTDAPLDSRNLERLAKRAFLGMGKTGAIGSNGSGDYIIAASTAKSLRIPYKMSSKTLGYKVLHNDAMSPLFTAVIEATEEAILNSLFMAEDMSGNGNTIKGLPKQKVLELLKKYGRLK